MLLDQIKLLSGDSYFRPAVIVCRFQNPGLSKLVTSGSVTATLSTLQLYIFNTKCVCMLELYSLCSALGIALFRT